MPEEEHIQPSEEVHTLATGGFVYGLPGMHGAGSRVVVDRETQIPLRILPPVAPASISEGVESDAANIPVQPEEGAPAPAETQPESPVLPAQAVDETPGQEQPAEAEQHGVEVNPEPEQRPS